MSTQRWTIHESCDFLKVNRKRHKKVVLNCVSLVIDKVFSIFEWNLGDFRIVEYQILPSFIIVLFLFQCIHKNNFFSQFNISERWSHLSRIRIIAVGSTKIKWWVKYVWNNFAIKLNNGAITQRKKTFPISIVNLYYYKSHFVCRAIH